MQFDTIQPIEIANDVVEKESMLLRTARVLAAGLGFLYVNVKSIERNIKDKLLQNRGPGIRTLIYGSSPEIADVHQDLVESAFRWYSVSLCDFVRVATTLGGMAKEDRENYTKTVLGGVQAFRDKVGAHTAGATKNGKDNDAERSFTPCRQIAWNDDRFAAGTFTMLVRRGGVESNSSEISPWKLTELHEQLCIRYPILAEYSRAEEPFNVW